MSIRAKVVLPDNVNDAYLRTDFIGNGATYSTELQSDSPSFLSPDSAGIYNKQSIVLSFQLEDRETRESVPLKQIISLKISNDPQMAPANTVEIDMWPAAAPFDPTQSYTYTLNPLFFVNPLANAQTLISGDGNTTPSDPTLAGTFTVLNWPLSATGGVASVYIQAVVQSTVSDEQISYPDGYGAYDQILWQCEPPSTPGVPIADARGPGDGWTGSETLWQFMASEEPSSGLYGSGVSRYVGDVIETREAIRNGYQLGYDTGGTPNQYVHGTYTGSTYTSAGTYTLNTNISTSSGTQYLVAQTMGLYRVTTAPDIGVNTQVNFPSIGSSPITISTTLSTGSQTSPFTAAVAYWATITVPATGITTATIYRTVSGATSPSTTFSANLPLNATALIRSSQEGTIELYISQRPNDNFALVTAYYTPHATVQSYVLGQVMMPAITSTDYWVGSVIVGGNYTNGFSVYSLLPISGRFLLGADLGDCQTDEEDASSPASSYVSGGLNWTPAVTSGDWLLLTRAAQTDGGTHTSVSSTVSSTGYSLHTDSPAYLYDRQYVELFAAAPTMSDRAMVRWTSLNLRGDFYVVLTATPPQFPNDPPRGVFCDPTFAQGDAPMGEPTLLIGFSAADNVIYVAERRADGTLTVKDWLPWAAAPAVGSTDPQNFTDTSSQAVTWTLIVSNRSEGTERGTFITLRRGSEVMGSSLAIPILPAANQGSGFYVGLGLRSYTAADYANQGIDSILFGGALLEDVLVRGLTPLHRDGELDSVGERHFRKANGSSSSMKPYLGQMMLSGITDEGNTSFTSPPATTWAGVTDLRDSILYRVQAVTASNITSTGTVTAVLDEAPNMVDAIPIFLGSKILVRSQTNPAENGIYVVTTLGTGANGQWSRVSDLESSSQVLQSLYAKCDDCYPVRLVTTSSVTPATAPTTVDGVTPVVGDLILLASGTLLGGVYCVTVAGTGGNTAVWVRTERFSSTSQFQSGQCFRVSEGNTYAGSIWSVNQLPNILTPSTPLAFTQITDGGPDLEGTIWYIDSVDPSFTIGTSAINWIGANYCIKVTPKGMAPFFTSGKIALLDMKVRALQQDYAAPISPRAKIITYDPTDNGPEGAALTPWMNSFEEGSGVRWTPEGAAAFTTITQFDISREACTITEATPLWLAIQVPPGMEVLTGNNTQEMVQTTFTSGARAGFIQCPGLWHKLFASKAKRHRNVQDNAYVQLRVLADSHARFPSNASPLSNSLTVDIIAPQYGSLGYAKISIPSLPTVRTVTVTIDATDTQSGISAFRIVKETDEGATKHSPWFPFAQYAGFVDLLPCKTSLEAANSGALTGLSVGGLTLNDGDRVLVYASAAQSYVGIYNAHSGAWTRVTDLNENTQLVQQLRVVTTLGPNAGDTWYPNLPSPAALPPFYTIGTTAWNWQMSPQRNVAQYTIYLYGTPYYGPSGTADDTVFANNVGFDGARKIWVQVMDAVGNVSEAPPVQATAQGIALVDTIPPMGGGIFVSADNGSPETLINYAQAILQLDGTDRVSQIKDFRTRSIGSGLQGAWTNWQSIADYSLVDVTNPFPNPGGVTDGLRRIEVQFRDYGGNIPQKAPYWDVLETLNTPVLLTCMAVWQSPQDLEAFYYAGGVKSIVYSNYTLVDSAIAFYGTNKAFYVQSNVAGSVGRTVLLTSVDQVTLTVNGTAWTQVAGTSMTAHTFYIDAQRGVVVVNSAPSLGATFVVGVTRNSAVVYKGDGRQLVEVADLGYLGEYILLSAIVTPNGLLFGSGNGNIYSFDGYALSGPVFTATEDQINLPITDFCVQQYPYESQPYLYATTGVRPRLYRTPLATSNAVSVWTACTPGVGPLGTGTGDATCICSALGKLFVGTSNGTVIAYVRTQSLDGDESEATTTMSLTWEAIGAGESSSMPVSCLLTSGSSVYAGIGNKPEVHRYSARKLPVPMSPEGWSRTIFDAGFFQDPSPWQYYTSVEAAGTGVNTAIMDGQTISRSLTANGNGIRWFAVSDPDTENGVKSYIAMMGAQGNEANVSCGQGSDWEQVISGKTTYTLEVLAARLSGSGKQGMRVGDGTYSYSLAWDDQHIYAYNGTGAPQVARLDGGTDSITTLSLPLQRDYGGGDYPPRGIIQIWSFAMPSGQPDNPYDREDTSPLYPGGDSTIVFSAQGWLAGDHVVAAAAGAAGVVVDLTTDDSLEDTTTFPARTRILRVTPDLSGDPIILLPSISPTILVSGGAKVMMRVRIEPATGVNIDQAVISFGWSGAPISDQGIQYWSDAKVMGENEFHTYSFTPAWDGPIAGVAVKIEGIKVATPTGGFEALTNTVTAIDFDYIAIWEDEANTSFSDNATPIRVGVNGQDVQVWVGLTDTPQLNLPGFLVLTTDKAHLRIGKVAGSEAVSEWAYSEVSFSAGSVVPPYQLDERGFKIAARFPSTGPVTQLLHTAGTAVALTDGVGVMRFADDPDDRAAKGWAYDPQRELWTEMTPAPPRLASGQGIVQFLAACDYRGALVTSGQSGQIAYAP